MGDKIFDTQKGSLESSVKDPIPIPSESDVIFDDDCDDDYQKRFDLKVQQLWMPSIYDENNKIRECHLIRSSAITPGSGTLSYGGNEHLDTIPVTESANTIKSSVEDLVPTPSESADLSDGESECDHYIDSIFDEFSLPRPPEESNSEISDATIESLSPSPILIEDSDSLMEEVDLFLDSDDSMPPGIENDDYDSEGGTFLY
ncbi:hypothetical protein Tco_0592360 [Tanacetum coccineum]